jgi:hypothetical protein
LPLTDGGETTEGITLSIKSLDPQLECSKAGTSLSFPEKGIADNPAYIKNNHQDVQQKDIKRKEIFGY